MAPAPGDAATAGPTRIRTRAEAQRLVARAAAAFPGWSICPVAERAEALSRIAEGLEAQSALFSATMIEETGMPRRWAEHNVAFAARILRQVAKDAQSLQAPVLLRQTDGFESRAERVPAGVVLGIAPWNAPLILGVRAMAAPLACGNTVLLKGNGLAPRSFALLSEVIEPLLPKDTVQVFLCRDDDSETIVDALVGASVVRRVNFTGSTRVGRQIAAVCAKHLKRPLLELGGQAQMIVLEDADLDLAAEAAIHGGYMNQGQICLSTERIIVAEPVAEALLAKIESRRAALVVGDPMDPRTDLGPVIDLLAAERLSGLVADAVSKGAVLVGGGGTRDSFFEPTLLDGVDAGMRLYHEEAFGPLLSVTRVASAQEAVTVANDSEYGLSAAVFGSDIARAQAVAHQIQSGICHINRSTVDDDPQAPFGGVKASGFGRFGGPWGLDEFTELRWITVHRTT